jgi:uncharacterized membrane protein
MSDLVVIAFPSEQRAEEVRTRVLEMQKEYLIELSDAVIAEKLPDGRIKLHQMLDTTLQGAASGSFWGLLVGLLFMMPLAGVAIGAASGALAGALTDFGINDRFMKDLAEVLQPGNAALFLLIRKMTADKVIDDLKGVGGTLLRTSLDHNKEAALRAALAGTVAASEPPAPTAQAGGAPSPSPAH